MTTGTTAIAGYLTNGHSYDFAVSATTQGGEGPRSVPVRVTAHQNPPATPTGLTATPTGAGTVILQWAAVPGEPWYVVFQRDATAGEPGFTRWPYPVTAGTSATAQFLTAGHLYEFRVAASNAGGDSAPTESVAVRPTAPAPPAPTGLTATADRAGTVALTWTAPAANLWYFVYQRDVTANETFRRWSAPVTAGTTARADSLLNGHVYEFRVTSTFADVESAPSGTVRATAEVAAPTTAPTGLRVVPTADGKAQLSWQAPGLNVWFAVYQRDVTAGQTAFVRWGMPATTPDALADGLVSGHVYEFKVSATNAGGEGPASGAVRVTAQGGTPPAPGAPTARARDHAVELSWPVVPGTGIYYWIYRRDVTTEAGYTRFTTPTTATSLTDTNVTNGDTYEYRVAASNSHGEGGWSAPARARPLPPLPAAPTGLSVRAGDGIADVSWTAPAPGLWYVVYRRNASRGQTFQELPYPVTTGTTFRDSYLVNGDTYEYKVAATNVAGTGPASAVVAARPLPPMPQAPAGLTASAGDGRAVLHWTASPTANVWYRLEMHDVTRHEGWREVPYPITGGTSTTATYLVNGDTYEFRLRATNIAGVSGPSNVVSVRPMPPTPAQPVNVRLDDSHPYQVTMTWDAVPGADGYFVSMKRLSLFGIAFPPSSLDRLPYQVHGTSFTFNSLLDPGRYYFAVAATRHPVVGPQSAMVMTVPYLDNQWYWEAKSWTSQAPPHWSRMTLDVGATTYDAGMVLVRGYIAEGLAYDYIGDQRTSTTDPLASAKLILAWDTVGGKLGAVAEQSCMPLYCADALPVRQGIGRPDGLPDRSNFVTASCDGQVLTAAWNWSNSILDLLPMGSWHINGRLTLGRGALQSRLSADRFPAYEVVQYPRYTRGGWNTGTFLATRDQTQIWDLVTMFGGQTDTTVHNV